MQSATADPRTSHIETEIRRISALLARGELAQASQDAQQLRTAAPDNRDVLYLCAVLLRQSQRIPEALDTLSTLERHHPQYSRLFEERGHCYRATRATGQAIDAYQRALQRNASLHDSWQALHILFRATRRLAEAQNAAGQAARLAALPPEIRAAFALYADGDVILAEEFARHYLETHGEHVEALRLLARMALNAGMPYDAELLLERALALEPQHATVRCEYAMTLLERQKHKPALEQLDRLLTLDPLDRNYRSLYATACAGLLDYERALFIYKSLSAERPQEPELHLAMGNTLKTLGRTQAAVDEYRQAAAVRPSYGEAYWGLANLKTYRFTDDEVARMTSAAATDAVAATDLCHLCFALGKALEDRGRYAESFTYYERGNALRKADTRYRADTLERAARQQAAVCTREFFAARQGFGSDSRAPIFIVGMPRSGSTLIEQILASHSQIEGTTELPDIPRLVQELQSSELAGAGPGYPRILGNLDAQMCRQLGENYLRDTAPYRSGKPHFIDKMPNNFRHLGLIHLILPNARIIDARRKPMACCFSVYKQLFAAGQRFAYSLDDIARYYRMYVGVMAHWDSVLPGKVLRIQHEDVVQNLEASVRRLLDFCELDYEANCLDFHHNRRLVHSASAEQVRQPLHAGGTDQWRHFDPWLGRLKAALAATESADA